jgi:Na+/H+ antiporter NhaC
MLPLSWVVIVPPILVLLITTLTKRLNLAFIISIIFAAWTASEYKFVTTAKLITNRSIDQITDIDYIYLYVFLLVIGMFIVLLDRTGGARAFAHTFTKHIRSARAAETSTLAVSAVLFVDDYLSNITSGYVMRPITDKFHVPRAKLAYIVHSVSIPLIILMPISSWVAMLTGQLAKAGIRPNTNLTTTNVKIIADPFFVFLATIPFIFYSFIALASVFIIIRRRISYGPMHIHEQIAKTDGNLFGLEKKHILNPEDPLNTLHNTHPSLIDFCIPLIVLIGTFIFTILYTGGYHLLGGNQTFINAFKNTDQSFFAICLAGLAAFGMGLFLALTRHKITLQDLPHIIKEGISMMYSSVIMLILASILGNIVRIDLHTGTYLASMLGNTIPAYLIPCMFYMVAFITAFLMGTSWGTIALLMPMAMPIITTFISSPLPVIPALAPLLYPVLGAIFSGATCGDQLSTISQTTLMASTSSGINPITHAKTQVPYAIPSIIGTALAFMISGWISIHGISLAANCLISLGSGLLISLLILLTINKINHICKA